MAKGFVGPARIVVHFSGNCSSRKKQNKKRIWTPELQLASRVQTLLVNLKLAIVQGEFEAAAVVERLFPKGQ